MLKSKIHHTLTKPQSKGYNTSGNKPSLRTVAINVLTEYLRVSSVHGVKHLIHPKWHPIERFLWGCVMLTCITYAIMNIEQAYTIYQKSPIVTSEESSAYHISSIPFPGIAFCNLNKIRKSALIALAKRLGQSLISETENKPKTSGTDIMIQLPSSKSILIQVQHQLGSLQAVSMKRLKMIPLLQLMNGSGLTFDETLDILSELKEFYTPGDELEPDRLKKYYHVLDVNNQRFNVSSILRELAHPCENMLKKCYWRGINYPCEELFMQTTCSVQGFCCVSRNTIHFENVSRNLYDETKKLDYDTMDRGHINWNTSIASKQLGLTIEVDVEPQEYFYGAYSSLNTYGIKVLTYDPSIYPDVASGGILQNIIPFKHETYIHIHATAEYSGLRVTNVHSKSSGCRASSFDNTDMPGEYTFSGCLFRCRLKNLTEMCGCKPFYIPFGPGNYPECTIEQHLCTMDHRDNWGAIKIGNNDSCHCEHACNRIFYNRHTTTHPIEANSPHFNSNTSVIHVYFDNVHAILYKRDILFQFEDVVSTIIGLCALFLGASIISLIELVYFLTFRFLSEIKYRDVKFEDYNSKFNIKLKKANSFPIYWNEILAEIV